MSDQLDQAACSLAVLVVLELLTALEEVQRHWALAELDMSVRRIKEQDASASQAAETWLTTYRPGVGAEAARKAK